MLSPLGELPVEVLPPSDVVSYATSELDLYTTFGRESYRKAREEYNAAQNPPLTTETQAPTFDPTKPIKSWSASQLIWPGHYGYYDTSQGGTPKWVEVPMSAVDASAVNIPGRMTFPARVLGPSTSVVVTGPNGQDPAQLNTTLLSTREEAEMLVAELIGSGVLRDAEVVDGAGSFSPNLISYGDDARRLWMIAGHTKFGVPVPPHFVGSLLDIRYRNGVGSPGYWEASGGVDVVVPDADAEGGARIDRGMGIMWQSTYPTVDPKVSDNHRVVPVPQRRLRDDEEWVPPGLIGEGGIRKKGAAAADAVDVIALRARVAALEDTVTTILSVLRSRNIMP